MLAYELFLKNKDSAAELGFKSEKPAKIVYFIQDGKNHRIEFDTRTIDEFKGGTKKRFAFLQNAWDMPLNRFAEIPYEVTGSRSLKPYLMLYGFISEKGVLFSYNGKDKSGEKLEFSAFFKPDGESEFKNIKDLRIKLEKKNYFVGEKSLHDSYIESGIIYEDSGKLFVKAKLLKEIVEKFMEKYSLKELDKINKIPFEIYVLPSKENLSYDDGIESGSKTAFIDAFGENSTGYSDKTTKTAKFLSFDDPAYTINTTEGNEFYRKIGISRESLEKVNLPGGGMKIKGLTFLFFDLANPELQFPSYGRGIYNQMLNNYRILKKKNDQKSSLKVICIKENQAQKEVLVDCNLTEMQLNQILGGRSVDGESAPNYVLEKSFIFSSGKNVVFTDYIRMLKNWLFRIPAGRDQLLQIFSRNLKAKRFDYLKNRRVTREGAEYIENTLFAGQLLCGDFMEMSKDEEFAYNLGRIAGRYVTFKRAAKEEPNSLLDILTYSKYDEAKLRFVFTKICQGIELSKASKEETREMDSFVKSVIKDTPLKLSEPNNDYSYFFYRGVFEEMGGKK